MASPTKLYAVKSPIRIKHKRRTEGTIRLTDDEAAAPLSSGAIELVEEPAPAPPPPPPPAPPKAPEPPAEKPKRTRRKKSGE